MKLKTWKAPLPPKRITPPAELADFFPTVEVASSARAAGEGLGMPRQSATVAAVVSTAPESSSTAQAISRPRFESLEEGEAGLAGPPGGPHPRWAGLGRAVSAMQWAHADRIRSRMIARVALYRFRDRDSFAAAAPPPSASTCASPPLCSASSSIGSAQRRSFAQVVAGVPALAGMADTSQTYL
jgi:hypothetical protein